MTHGWTNARQRDARLDDPDIGDDGAIEIALNPWMIDRLRKLHPEIDPNLSSTVKSMVGPQFSDAEIHELKERALKAAKVVDLPVLQGIEAGVPVDLNRQQAGVIDRIVSGLGADALGRRAQGASCRAREAGQAKVR